MFISQPILVLCLALAFGLVGATATASSAFTITQRDRAFYLCALTIGIVVTARAITALNLRFNFTPSMPVGVYRLTAASPMIKLPRGSLVAVCAPLKAAELGRRRGYLAAGVCPAGSELLLKEVVAAGGDDVAASTAGIYVNGCLLPRSRPLTFDAAGRTLSRWPEGRYRLRRGQLWLYAANDRSWDSRYWGPTTGEDVTGRAIPLWIFPLAFHSTSDSTRCDGGG